MRTLKCKVCGGDMDLSADRSVATCQYCGTKTTVPKTDDDQLVSIFNRGNSFRMAGEFDNAMQVYENLLQQDNQNAEAHWRYVLCKYGIEYVKDPASGRYIPTCHRASYDSILQDPDYLAALRYADFLAKGQYQAEAEEIAAIQKKILEVSSQEQPYDVFICYKETDAAGQRTRDSVKGQELYYALTEQGYRVFFARITLEDKVGREYEPYIFSALHSARVMVILGTDPGFFKAVWVKNEWSRFLKLAEQDRSRLILPCYADMDSYDLPDQLSIFQCYDMNRIGFMQELVRGIGKVLGKQETEAQPAAPSILGTLHVGVREEYENKPACLLRKARWKLRNHEWEAARTCADEVLAQDPENADAHVCLLCAEMEVVNPFQLRRMTSLRDPETEFRYNDNYQNALRCADPDLRRELKRIPALITEAEKLRRFQSACSGYRRAKTAEQFLEVSEQLEQLGSWRNCRTLADKARQAAWDMWYEEAEKLIENRKKPEQIDQAGQILKKMQGDPRAAKRLKELPALREALEEKLAKEEKENAFRRAIEFSNDPSMYTAAATLFKGLGDYCDSRKRLENVQELISQQQRRETRKKIKKVILKILMGGIIAFLIWSWLRASGVVGPLLQDCQTGSETVQTAVHAEPADAEIQNMGVAVWQF